MKLSGQLLYCICGFVFAANAYDVVNTTGTIGTTNNAYTVEASNGRIQYPPAQQSSEMAVLSEKMDVLIGLMQTMSLNLQTLTELYTCSPAASRNGIKTAYCSRRWQKSLDDLLMDYEQMPPTAPSSNGANNGADFSNFDFYGSTFLFVLAGLFFVVFAAVMISKRRLEIRHAHASDAEIPDDTMEYEISHGHVAYRSDPPHYHAKHASEGMFQPNNAGYHSDGPNGSFYLKQNLLDYHQLQQNELPNKLTNQMCCGDCKQSNLEQQQQQQQQQAPAAEENMVAKY